MKVKTSELEGELLDRAVVKCEFDDDIPAGFASRSRNWAYGGPIIEREKMRIAYNFDEHIWEAGWDCHVKGWGDTPLIAAMRCYVVNQLGDEVEVPDELLT